MEWLKHKYDRVILLILAIALIAASLVLFSQTKSFDNLFAEAKKNIPPGTEFKPAEITTLEKAIADISKPAQWENHPGYLFVSRKYLVQNNKLVDPLEDGSHTLHPPIPNQWLLDHNLDLLDPGILNTDPDKDGFSVLEEFLHKADPTDPNSRPPYWTKIRLKRAELRRFRLLFAAAIGGEYQINTLDVRLPSQFLKIGDKIQGTKFKITKYEQKTQFNPKSQGEEDVSELTIEHEETGQEVILIVKRVTDSPDSFALFTFLIDGSEFRVKKDQTFSLKVEPDVTYKLIDIQAREAVITNTATGERHVIPHVEASASTPEPAPPAPEE